MLVSTAVDEVTSGGRSLPDHGELWSIPWQEISPERGGIRYRGECRRSPLALEREIHVVGGDLCLDYRLINTGRGPVRAFWAAHPFFAAPGDTRVDLDGAPASVMITHPSAAAGEVPWPAVEDRVGRLAVGEFLKVRLGRAQGVTASLVDGEDALYLSWSGSALRDLALVWDNRTFAEVRAIAIEPGTADGDTPLAAGCLVLADRDAMEWSLRLRGGRPDAA